MSDNPQKSWSNNPYAPQIAPRIYFDEKAWFTGLILGLVCYGIVIVLFFQCMGALLNPVDRERTGIRKWAFVAHATVMFSIVTISNVCNLAIHSLSYIDNRELLYPGSDNMSSGPFNYYYDIIIQQPIVFLLLCMLVLNYWLADGLLLYRCYVLYAGNFWAIAFPCLMYLASLAMGLEFLYQEQQPGAGINPVTLDNFGKAYYSVSLSLDVLLTLMIVARIVLHSRDIRSAMGSLVKPDRLYKAVVTILVESCALYAAAYLLFLVPWASGSPVCNAFSPLLTDVQVIAPFLVILRVANRSALTSDSVASGSVGSLHFKSQGKSAGDSGTLLDACPTGSMEIDGWTPGEAGVGAATTIDEVPA